MDWYYASNGQQNGPVSQEQLIQLHQSGQIKSSDLVWNEGMTDWAPFQNVPELAPPAAGSPEPTAAAPATTQTQPSSSSASPYLTPSASAAQSTHSPVNEADIPTTYLWQSIVCLVLCCLPLAIPALIFATKVKPLAEAGNLAEAREASSKAKMWCWISFGVGLVVQVLYLGLVAVGAMAEAGAI